MTASSFNLILTIYLSLTFPRSHGMEAVKTSSRTVGPDGVASIACECTTEIKTLEDVRLNVVSLADNNRRVLCQKGSNSCHLRNVYMTPQDPTDPKKWLFFMTKVEAKDMNLTYECEFTVCDASDLHQTWRGEPVTLLQGQKEAEKGCAPPPPSPSPPPASQPDPMGWVLIGLLVLLLLCICVIIHLCIRLRKSKAEYDNGTYVEMRKAPLLRKTPAGVYCGN